MNNEIEQIKLSEQEEEFCKLYVYGGGEYAGKGQKCYKEVFGEKNKNPYAGTPLARISIRALFWKNNLLLPSNTRTTSPRERGDYKSARARGICF